LLKTQRFDNQKINLILVLFLQQNRENRVYIIENQTYSSFIGNYLAEHEQKSKTKLHLPHLYYYIN